MGAYLDRLNSQYDEIVAGIDTLVSRAADDNRDVTDDEQKQVDRDRGRLDELTKAIEHYSAIESQAGKVADLRRSVPASPASRSTSTPEPEAYDILREFPTAADYAIAVHRAMVERDPEAREKLDRATAHQTTADNPGLIPRPILGPVLNLIDATRPFINSITRKPLPSGKFDRPTITQHVAVGKQAAEKTLTESQKLLVGLLPVVASTYAGHLNISRQDVKWTSPGILQIVFDDFAAIYAQQTCDDAVAQFEASVVQTDAIGSADAAGVNAALFKAVAAALTAGSSAIPDTLWVAPDVWASLGSLTVGTNGAPAYPSMSLTSTSGAPLGLKLVVDGHFTAGTAIVGPSRLAEWYEDVDGLMQVQEPDVLGQLVGYAGFGAFVNVAPTAFTKITGVPALP
jgi:HK97 family phage major capsid protein